jgi:hypothetical protein
MTNSILTAALILTVFVTSGHRIYERWDCEERTGENCKTVAVPVSVINRLEKEGDDD